MNLELAKMQRAWRLMESLPAPRNAAALRKAREAGDAKIGDQVVLSFVDRTELGFPHLFVDPGRRYDLRCVTGLFATVATRPGIDARKLIEDLCVLTQPYVTLMDVERQVVASVVDGAGGAFKLWPRRRGGEAWRAYFG